MSNQPRLTSQERIWFTLLFALGGIAFALAVVPVVGLCAVGNDRYWLLGFGFLIFASLFRNVRLSSEDYYSVYTLDDIPIYALIFVKGWPFAVVAGMAARFCFEIWRLMRALRVHPERVHWVYVLYHCSDVPAVGVVTGLTGAAYGALNPGGAFLSTVAGVGAVFAASFVWLPVAFSITAVSLTLRRHLPFWEATKVLKENFGHVRVHIAMLVPLGTLLAVFIERQPIVAALLLVPITMMHNALDSGQKLRSESEHTIQALAHALEERDEYTQGHSERVSRYGAEIAREMGLSAEDVDQVRRAGLIHDIGKVDIPDAILRKPGRLSVEERQIMRTHTDRAVELGEKLVEMRKELPFHEAAFHHENYDGSGHYGMAAEEIPLTSRILAVADTFDAMTSDRPYRKGMPLDEAKKLIEAVRGTQLDPRAVDAFLAACQSGAIGAVKARWSERARPNS